MGFLDKLMGTAKQAANPIGAKSEQNKIMKINKSGVDGRATVNSMHEHGTQLGGGHDVEFELTVHPAGGDNYAVKTRQSIHTQTLEGIAEGVDVIVKIDPDDPQSLLVWGKA